MAVGRARLAIAQGMSVWVLEAPDGFGDAHFHSHHAVQITFSLAGSLTITDGDRTIEGAAIAVAADARHRFEAHGMLAFVFVEPESRTGRSLHRRLFGERAIAPIDADALRPALDRLAATFDDALGPDALLAAGQAALDALAPPGEPVAADPRIDRIIAQAAATPGLSLDRTAAEAGVYLSPSRLRHLFVEQTGLAFKTYTLWLRMVRALQVYAEGQSLTEAAHAAGFADSAHFSRVFKRNFGLPATTLTRL